MLNVPDLCAVIRLPTTRSHRALCAGQDMPMIRPPALKPGDTVAAISLSSGLPALFPHRYEAGKRQFAETFGLTVIETPNALRDNAWLHDNPQARADDL